MNKNNGGPAFPQQFHMSPRLDQGMTLRDYFAAKALPGFLSTCERWPGGATSSLSAEAIAKACYERADAMIAERAKSGVEA